MLARASESSHELPPPMQQNIDHLEHSGPHRLGLKSRHQWPRCLCAGGVNFCDSIALAPTGFAAAPTRSAQPQRRHAGRSDRVDRLFCSLLPPCCGSSREQAQ